MSDPVDVELMALADGVLERGEAEALQTRVAASPELAQRLTMFEATRDLGAPFRAILNAPIPDRLIAAVMSGGVGGGTAPADAPKRSADVLQFRRPEEKRKSVSRGFDSKVWALGLVAAGMLAVIGIGQWQRTAPGAGSNAGPQMAVKEESAKTDHVAQGSSPAQGPDMAMLGPVLEKLASNSIGALADGSWSVKPVNTLPVPDGRWCRELNLKGGGSYWAGLACRSRMGGWQMQAMVEWVGAKPAFAAGAVRPSGLEPPDEIAEAAKKAGAGNPVDSARESALIAQGWK